MWTIGRIQNGKEKKLLLHFLLANTTQRTLNIPTGPLSHCVLHERTDKCGNGPSAVVRSGLRYLGTDRSPLVLFSGLQRSVTTVLRPDGQDDIASSDLNGKFTHVNAGLFFLNFLQR